MPRPLENVPFRGKEVSSAATIQRARLDLRLRSTGHRRAADRLLGAPTGRVVDRRAAWAASRSPFERLRPSGLVRQFALMVQQLLQRRIPTKPKKELARKLRGRSARLSDEDITREGHRLFEGRHRGYRRLHELPSTRLPYDEGSVLQSVQARAHRHLVRATQLQGKPGCKLEHLGEVVQDLPDLDDGVCVVWYSGPRWCPPSSRWRLSGAG